MEVKIIGKPYVHRREKKNDNLPTPYSMTEQLLENEKFDYRKEIYECACGKNAIVKVLKNYFDDNKIFADDIKYCCGKDNPHDFLLNKKYTYDYIITNPPWSLWDEFIIKAKQIAIEKFAFLGDMDFLTGIDRYKNKLYFDGEYGLARVYGFVRKCDLRGELREDGKYPAGCICYGWYVFEKGWDKNYYIGKWINNQRYILKKSID